MKKEPKQFIVKTIIAVNLIMMGIIYYKGYLVHYENGPAIEWKNGDKFWFLNGQLHREDGPAIEWLVGYKLFYLNGDQYLEKEYLKIINLKNKKKILNIKYCKMR